jgi:hypothetical protein
MFLGPAFKYRCQKRRKGKDNVQAVKALPTQWRRSHFGTGYCWVQSKT